MDSSWSPDEDVPHGPLHASTSVDIDENWYYPQKEQWKIKFDDLMFPNHQDTPLIDSRDIDVNSISQTLDRNNIKNIITFLKRFNYDDDINPTSNEIKFRRDNYSKGFRWSKLYSIHNSIHSDGTVVEWLQRNGKRVCPIEEIFDAIVNGHEAVGHKRVASTYNYVKQMYSNITEAMIKKCLSLCPVCALSNDNVRTKDIGLGISIKSSSFISHIQVDLIDFSMDPRKDYNGVTMKWLLVIKLPLYKVYMAQSYSAKIS